MRHLAIIFSVVLLSGCAALPVTIAASSSPLPPGVRGDIRAEGHDCQYYLLGLIPISGDPNSAEALKKAKKSANVDVLTDITVDFSVQSYILVSETCVRIEGLGVSRERLQEIDLL